MSEYTPTTEEVRTRATVACLTPLRPVEFDRWLAAHDAEVAARAWDEGAQSQAAAYGMDKDTGPNPYRAVEM